MFIPVLHGWMCALWKIWEPLFSPSAVHLSVAPVDGVCLTLRENLLAMKGSLMARSRPEKGAVHETQSALHDRSGAGRL